MTCNVTKMWCFVNLYQIRLHGYNDIDFFYKSLLWTCNFKDMHTNFHVGQADTQYSGRYRENFSNNPLYSARNVINISLNCDV